MRRPPSPLRLPEYPIAGGIGLMAIVVTLMTFGDERVDALAVSPLVPFWSEPWRVVTCALPHGDAFHLIFNVFWLWIFGTALEEVYGSVTTFVLFVVLQVGAGAAEYAFLHGGIGLSGIVYGLVGMLWVLSRRDPRFVGTMDRGTLRLFAIWFVFCCVATALGVMRIGNIAHGVGFVLGVVLGWIYAPRPGLQRPVALVVLAALLTGALLGASVFRASINLAAVDHAFLGYQAHQAHQYDEAIRQYRLALDREPSDAATWYNLGLVLGMSGKLDDALDAERKAHDLDILEPTYRDGLRLALLALALDDQAHGKHADAVKLYKEALQISGDRADVLHQLAASLTALGRTQEADKVTARAAALEKH